eukprot:PITA_30893
MGLNIARGVKNINHALFADDSLLLCVASLTTAKHFKEVLDDYCEDSGSRLNKGKCHIYCWNSSARSLQTISNCFGFATSSSWSSFKYLGLPVFQKRALNKDWLPLLEKFKLKIHSRSFNWLNLAGKTVLVKAVLNSLPIYQSAVMMAPIGVMRKIEDYIRNFFWKGGKANEKKIPLLNWDRISLPRREGRLNFKNISKQNIALGAKLLWRIIAPNPGWTQLVMWKKYFCGQRIRCLDKPKPITKSMVHKLCIKASPLINLHAHWIPRNGKINIWDNCIMGSDPLSEDHSLVMLRDWMDRAGLKTLWDISHWDNGKWRSWINLVVPHNLSSEFVAFHSLLAGKAPMNIRKPDTWGWGLNPGCYTVTQGYNQLSLHPHVPPDPKPWQDFVLPNRCVELFANWKSRYPGGSPQNVHIKEAWFALPKLICWHIWLERNQRIFRDKKNDPKIIWEKIKSHLRDCLSDQLDGAELSDQEAVWGTYLDLQFIDIAKLPSPLKKWKIRLEAVEFSEFYIKKERNTLFFDGAAKGNPGLSSAGGVIKSTEGRTELRFAWGVGFNTSIQAEALALFQGLKQLTTLGIKEATIIADSQSIIKIIVNNSLPSDLRLSRLMSRIRNLINSFQNLEFLHVKRDNNKEADAEANKAALLPHEVLLRNEDEGWDPIP